MKNSKKHRLALLREVTALRERIRRHVGPIDVLEALDQSRDARMQELISCENEAREGERPLTG